MNKWIKPFNFDFLWKTVKNEYGQLLAFEPPKFFEGFKTLQYQGNITQLIRSNKYNCFVDVGAAWGYFPRIASKHCETVIAFEANPIRYGFLLYNTRDLHNVSCRYKYVGSQNSIPKMDNALQMIKKSSKQLYNVETATLDKELAFLIAPNYGDFTRITDTTQGVLEGIPTLIKIDIEGAELDALAGAQKLLELENVHWTIDIHPAQGVKPQQVINIMNKFGKKHTSHGNTNFFFY